MSKTQLYKTTIDLGFKLLSKNDMKEFEKAIATYLSPLDFPMPSPDIASTNVGIEIGTTPASLNSTLPEPSQSVDQISSNYFQDLRNYFEKQPDLLYGLSVFASEGVNKNRDVFLRDILCRIFKTPRNKFVDWEHDAEGENKGGQNPEGYQIVGHIYDSKLASQITGSMIPDEDVFVGEDGKYFSKDSQWRGQPLDLLVAWVLYKFQFPELATIVENMTDIDREKFGVSMEILFSDYKFRIGGVIDPEESFDFDGNSTGAWEVRKGDKLADTLQKLWIEGKGRTWNGRDVVRVLGGDIFFSGMAITRNRANTRSLNLSVGSYIEKIKKENTQPSELLEFIRAVASKSETFDLATCEIVDGKPSCGCINKAFAAEIDNLNNNLDDLISSIAKIKTKDQTREV